MNRTTKSFNAALACLAGALLCGGATALAQPSISNVYPNGTNMFQPSATLSFAVTSGSGVTNITVDLTSTNLYSGTVLRAHRTSANGLTIAGSNVSTPLSANTLYGATITAYDASGNSSVSVGFDTINPSYTWEAEDWDYTANGVSGLFIDNPQVNAYANLATSSSDANNNNGQGSYRPYNPGLATEGTGDQPMRLAYIGTTNTDFDVGWTDGGDWGNYTRHYPAGTYNMFVRAAGGNGPQTESADISVASGSASISSAASSPTNTLLKAAAGRIMISCR